VLIEPAITLIARLEVKREPHILIVPIRWLIGFPRRLEPIGLLDESSVVQQDDGSSIRHKLSAHG